MDIPYASPPQGIKYFTIIGPHIDCMDDRYLVSICLINLHANNPSLCFCLTRSYINTKMLLQK